MKKIFFLILSLFSIVIVGAQKCDIEFYFLKSIKPNVDVTKQIMSEFIVEKEDLQDTAFIKDVDIINYTIIEKEKICNKKKITIEKHVINIADDKVKQILNLSIPLKTGQQFALVIDGDIVYSGYIWNPYSSFGCDAITLIVHDMEIVIYRKLGENCTTDNDPRRSKVLFECLNKTNRLVIHDQ